MKNTAVIIHSKSRIIQKQYLFIFNKIFIHTIITDNNMPHKKHIMIETSKHFREMLGIKQKALAFELGDD